ncbi:hypothetical protein MCOR27_008004 [Pyricularia oryzae]|uniref:Uncharacterized protein n=3 Tax=Pyricularia TaxID=48558 RepID=A0ABQ8N798_PYRGI|nr:uncharacterized protein MGG_06646 [Pyricularia oryzae 70-15]KAH8842494.1 hypothetical protein MCOR01_006400 [Pyricularia oryzae]KAI6292436.1 hypothetical protein MCOR33_009865 [Pyricularia grisea]EHA56740.1 hypothetical protein MGG_06646 [Pyricularia oryzae 70-15]KAH9435744.1 hypothetical protein MCOR02_004663 [Pyricularia oryzae]KAI6258586.1 hypothetical protein MCOR19_005043 [Pyricularia oryzae]
MASITNNPQAADNSSTVLSDEELDRDWKPNGRRPHSTIARSFSAELMDIFRIENSLADLDSQVDKRKQELSSRTTELESLEQRIKEMEARLRQRGSPPNSTGPAANSASPRHVRSPISGVFDESAQSSSDGSNKHQDDEARRHESRAAGEKYAGSRPGTARASRQAVPGALPPTPTESEDGDRERDHV